MTRKHLQRRPWAMAIAVGLVLASISPAPLAADALIYKYDSRGRLTQVCNMLQSNAQLTNYTFDAADNRVTYVNTKPDFVMSANSEIVSGNGQFTLQFQDDGNLVLYQVNGHVALWQTGTNGTGASYVYFQSDGNLVIYTPSQGVWTSGTQSPCSSLSVQNDGNVVIYSSEGKKLWQTDTGGH